MNHQFSLQSIVFILMLFLGACSSSQIGTKTVANSWLYQPNSSTNFPRNIIAKLCVDRKNTIEGLTQNSAAGNLQYCYTTESHSKKTNDRITSERKITSIKIQGVEIPINKKLSHFMIERSSANTSLAVKFIGLNHFIGYLKKLPLDAAKNEILDRFSESTLKEISKPVFGFESKTGKTISVDDEWNTEEILQDSRSKCTRKVHIDSIDSYKDLVLAHFDGACTSKEGELQSSIEGKLAFRFSTSDLIENDHSDVREMFNPSSLQKFIVNTHFSLNIDDGK